MAKSLQEIAAALRDRLIYMDGLGDIGPARADQVLALTHEVQGILAYMIEDDVVFDRVAKALEKLLARTDALTERLERLERIYLPQSGEVQ